MTWAWKQGNLDVAKLMFDQTSELVSTAAADDAEQLADLVFEIGHNLFKKKDYSPATKWLERAHHVLEQAQAEGLSPDVDELRLSVAHHLGQSRLDELVTHH